MEKDQEGNRWESMKRRAEHRRHPELESALERLNSYLHRSRGQLQGPSAPTMPVLFIVGCARGGSTILFQSLAASGYLAYPTNIISRFYRDPYLGALVHKVLYDLDHNFEIVPEQAREISFSSRLGRAQGAAAPHDFGYFWRNYFTFGEKQSDLLRAPSENDKHELAKDVAGMEEVFGRPVLLKAMEMNWHIPLVRAIFPNSVFIFNRRDILQNAISLFNARKNYVGSEEGWYSYRPAEYEAIAKMAPWEQVVAQVWYTEMAVAKGLERIPKSDVIEVQYEELCRSPAQVHDRIWQRIGTGGGYSGPQFFSTKETSIPPELQARAKELLKALSSDGL